MRTKFLYLSFLITLLFSSYDLQAAAADIPPRIYARSLTGRMIPLDLKTIKEHSTPVQWMKEQIAADYGLTFDKVNILYRGASLTDELARSLERDAQVVISLKP